MVSLAAACTSSPSEDDRAQPATWQGSLDASDDEVEELTASVGSLGAAVAHLAVSSNALTLSDPEATSPEDLTRRLAETDAAIDVLEAAASAVLEVAAPLEAGGGWALAPVRPVSHVAQEGGARPAVTADRDGAVLGLGVLELARSQLELAEAIRRLLEQERSRLLMVMLMEGGVTSDPLVVLLRELYGQIETLTRCLETFNLMFWWMGMVSGPGCAPGAPPGETGMVEIEGVGLALDGRGGAALPLPGGSALRIRIPDEGIMVFPLPPGERPPGGLETPGVIRIDRAEGDRGPFLLEVDEEGVRVERPPGDTLPFPHDDLDELRSLVAGLFPRGTFLLPEMHPLGETPLESDGLDPRLRGRIDGLLAPGLREQLASPAPPCHEPRIASARFDPPSTAPGERSRLTVVTRGAVTDVVAQIPGVGSRSLTPVAEDRWRTRVAGPADPGEHRVSITATDACGQEIARAAPLRVEPPVAEPPPAPAAPGAGGAIGER